MKFLICCVFGTGNTILKIPFFRFLSLTLTRNNIIDVMIGSTKDDIGASEVLKAFNTNTPFKQYDKLYIDFALEREYDYCIELIPYDGRWKNGINYRAKTVIDSRSRADPNTIGLSSWKKHEVLYQFENFKTLKDLGCDVKFDEEIDSEASFSCVFTREKFLWDKKLIDKSIYLGLGY